MNLRSVLSPLLLVLLCCSLGWAQKSPKSSLAAASTASSPASAGSSSNVLLDSMQHELSRAMASLSKADPAPYYMSYSATDRRALTIAASHGALLNTLAQHNRLADVSVRVSSPALDNSHGENRHSVVNTVLLPLEDDGASISRILWQATDREYKNAAATFLRVKTDKQVRAEEEDKSPDFSEEKPEQYVGKVSPIRNLDQHAWEERLRHYSALLKKYPDVYRSLVSLQVEDNTRYFVSSEGTRVVTEEPLIRLIAIAETRADDGMELLRSESFDATTPGHLAAESEITSRINKLGSDLEKLRAAPVVAPYDGPAMLSGRAAAVFFHEVLGHRVEGQRQRGVEEGQTFTKKLNEKVLPDFLSVVDDPTKRELAGTELNGYYQFDDEGVRSRAVTVVDKGVLKEFLMSRMPITAFQHSNGHGRAEPGQVAVGRQGNLIVTSTNGVPEPELRKRFIEEIKKQGKPYGLYFEDIAGGFTLTTREMPQAFQVLPLMVWKVYPDGRPDELVRGVDIVGTPLAAMTRIILTGDKEQVFNGVCGAESGSVPVSAAAPAMLLSEIEVQKRKQTQDRPPILPPPSAPTKTASTGEKATASVGSKSQSATAGAKQ